MPINVVLGTTRPETRARNVNLVSGSVEHNVGLGTKTAGTDPGTWIWAMKIIDLGARTVDTKARTWI